MNDKPKLSRSRQKRTQERTRLSKKHEPLNTKVLLCSILLWAMMLLTLQFGRQVQHTHLTNGQLAPATVVAEVDFQSVNLAATALEREKAGAAVPPVLLIRDSGRGEAERTLIKAFDRLLEEGSNPESNSFHDVVELLGLSSELQELPQAFSKEELTELRPELLRLLGEHWERGLVSEEDRSTFFGGSLPAGRLHLGEEGSVRNIREFLLPAEAAGVVVTELSSRYDMVMEQRRLLRVLMEDLLRPNLLLDPSATRSLRQDAIAAVAPQLQLIRDGDTLMEARRPVTPQMIEDLRAHQQELSRMADQAYNVSLLIGSGISLALGIALSLAVLSLLEMAALQRLDRLLLWMLLTESTLLAGKLLLGLSEGLTLFDGPFLLALLPHAIGPLLGTILYGPRLGLAVGITSSTALALLMGNDLTVFFGGLALSVTSAISVRAIHKRINLIRSGLYIGGISALILIADSSMDQVPLMTMGQQALVALGVGILCPLLVLLMVPGLEWMFKVTTDIRLLELSDMSHPLLSRLALEAPGTYHHSLMVAHLAQAAAKEIGANDMLVRVCAYYHDIGKLTKPDFFIENNHTGNNPHDELSPSMSRLIIISHVKEGVSLARRYKLPQVIIDAIESHHGTSVIQYFYHRAKTRAEEADVKEDVKVEDYRYPGPRPASKEMGILLLADSIEAASRSIDKNKAGQIEGLVNEILKERLNDGQFDHCPLSMEELNRIRRSFIFSLQNMLHGRVAYPKEQSAEELNADHASD